MALHAHTIMGYSFTQRTLRDSAKKWNSAKLFYKQVEWSNPEGIWEAWMFLTKYYLCKSIYNKLQSF
jgi:hypothetical protein